MDRVLLAACVLACAVVGTFGATAPASPAPSTKAATPSKITCTNNFMTDLSAQAKDLDISTFVELMQALDVATDGGVYTALAPTDGAIQAAVGKLGVSADPSKWTPAQKSLMTELLKYHFGSVQSKVSTLTQYGSSFTTLANNLPLCKSLANKQDKDNRDNFNSVTLKEEAGKATVTAGGNVATIVKADVEPECTTNFIIQVIDAVLLPCSIDTIVESAGSLGDDDASPPPAKVKETSPPPAKKTAPPAPKDCAEGTIQDILMKSANTAAAPVADIIDNDYPDFKGTVLLPSAAAVTAAQTQIAAAAGGLDASSASQVLATILEEVRKYHIIPGKIITAASLSKETKVASALADVTKQTFCKPASDGEVTFVPGTDIKVEGLGSNATVQDSKTACNGIILEIDSILLPCSLADSMLSQGSDSTKDKEPTTKSPSDDKEPTTKSPSDDKEPATKDDGDSPSTPTTTLSRNAAPGNSTPGTMTLSPGSPTTNTSATPAVSKAVNGSAGAVVSMLMIMAAVAASLLL